jgi:predicted DNA-binding transcriptional regulator YafY
MASADTSPTARALLALEVIQRSPGVTAGRLAERLGVSERAARRYVAILREAGIPLESMRGPYGGYRVGRGLRLPPLMFDATEALALVMAVLDGHHQAADAEDPAGRALGKIIRALPEPVAAQAEAVRHAAAPAPDLAAARPDPQTTTALVQACADRLRIRIGYRTESGREWSQEVDPWAVVVRHGRWYLLCWSHAAAERRAFRIDRITGTTSLDTPFTPQPGLDAVSELEDHLSAGWEYDTDVVVEASRDQVAGIMPRALGRLEAVTSTSTRLVGSTSNPVWYAEQLAVLPVPYRIVHCPELRAAAREIGRRMSDAADG